MKIDVPYGPNTAQIAGYSFGKLDNDKQTPYIELVAMFEGQQEGRQKFFLSDAAAPYTLRKLEALGCNALSSESPDGEMLNMAGLRLWEDVTLDVRRNNRNPEYQDWDVPNTGGGGGHEIGQQESKVLGDKLRALLKKPGAAPQKDSDVPF